MDDNPVPENTNPMLENLLADIVPEEDDTPEEVHDLLSETAWAYRGEIEGHFDNDPVADFGQPAVDQVGRLVDFILRSTGEVDEPAQCIAPKRIAAEVLDEVRCELDRYEDNAEDGTTIQDAATDVVQRLHDLYDVMPIPKDTERTWYTCLDCDCDDMTEQTARWHVVAEGHLVHKLDDEEED